MLIFVAIATALPELIGGTTSMAMLVGLIGLAVIAGMAGRVGTRGRGKSEASLALIAAASRILAEIHRHRAAVCYRLFVAGMIDSMEKRKTSRVSK